MVTSLFKKVTFVNKKLDQFDIDRYLIRFINYMIDENVKKRSRWVPELTYESHGESRIVPGTISVLATILTLPYHAKTFSIGSELNTLYRPEG